MWSVRQLDLACGLYVALAGVLTKSCSFPDEKGVCLFVCLFVLTTPGMPVVALLPLRRLSQGATQSIPGLRLKKLGAALPLALW